MKLYLMVNEEDRIYLDDVNVYTGEEIVVYANDLMESEGIFRPLDVEGAVNWLKEEKAVLIKEVEIETTSKDKCAWKSFEGKFCPEAQDKLDKINDCILNYTECDEGTPDECISKIMEIMKNG